MQDDNKQPSYERLDDTNPERNKRSFFDWLRGREETDEEKLRKKLDEELKEAARQRAEQFEEERRLEEQREVAETKKLKKRWRAKLVEKSRKLLEEASGQGDEPVNGFDIAKLMVAERIVTLHDMLSDESLDLRRSEIKSIKIHIDFMGLLSEKLDRPELDVPEEIEQLYQTIAASVEETTGETPPEPHESRPETAPTPDVDTAYTTFAIGIVNAIRRVLRPESSPSSGETATPPSPLRPAPQPEQSERGAPQKTAPTLAEQLLGVVKEAAQPSETIRKELSHTEHARHLAEVVEKATIIHRYEPATTEGPLEPVMTEKNLSQSPDKKAKFMSELELVTLARQVEVGNGRLLSDVYAKGELDREGLVKVIEKYRKGQDYRSELIIRREKWRQHKIASPEYLSQPSAPPAATPPPPPQPQDAKRRTEALGSTTVSHTLSNGTTPQQHSPTTPSKLTRPEPLQKAAEIARTMRTRLKREGQMAVLFVSVLLVIVLVVAVLGLTSR